MANASSKRIAASNTRALQNLNYGLIISNVLPFLIRFILRKRLIPSWGPLTLNLLTTAGSLVLASHLNTVGKSRKDAQGLLKAGEDLNASGITEWCWDIIYMTWLCVNGSALLGNWIWWFYLAIPAFGGYKLFLLARPLLGMVLPGIFGPKSSVEPSSSSSSSSNANAGTEPELSRKQQKLKARMDKGDKRVQQQQQKR